MASFFLDTSALVKRYRREDGTDVVDRIFADSASVVIISRLALIEAISALALLVRTGAIQLTDYAVAKKRFLAEVASSQLKVARLLVSQLETAERLIERHGPLRPLRTLDALQLAVALGLHREKRIDTFASADVSLCEIARLEGLTVLNPLSAS
jgi:predicted nucleic acid-binding protein